MSDFPPGVLPTIRHALVLNLLDAHRRVGDDLPACDLYPEIIRALKWVHSQDPDTAVWAVWHALEEVSGYTETEGGPTTEAAARCLRFSLTRDTPPFDEWSEVQADRFITAALIKG
ncbi:hypothetical protein ACQSMD_33430 [Streptomyces flavovirens]|uniref:hypothetical protein n=1 Tax=Streptomyces TaxID=1883 RepID=UPI002FCA3FE5